MYKNQEGKISKQTVKQAREAYQAALKQAWEAYEAAIKQAREVDRKGKEGTKMTIDEAIDALNP